MNQAATLSKAALLLIFLASYGATIEGSPDIIPAWNNYQQDIVGGNTLIGNLTLVDGERMFSSTGVPNIDTTDYSFKWFIDDSLVYNYSNPRPNQITPSQDGVIMMRLEVTYKPNNLTFGREYWSYLGYNNVPDNEDPDRPGQFEVFTDFWPEVEQYHFAMMDSDLNGDGRVNASDLLIFLVQLE